MADAFAQQAPSEQAGPSDEGQPYTDADATVGVSGMEAIEAEAGQMFRYIAHLFICCSHACCSHACSNKCCHNGACGHFCGAYMFSYVLHIVPLHFRLLAICLSQWQSCAKTTANHAHHKGLSVSRTCCHCSDWLAEDKAKAIADEKRRIEEEEANMLVGPELPAGVSQQDMGDYGGALLPGKSSKEAITIIHSLCCFQSCSWVFKHQSMCRIMLMLLLLLLLLLLSVRACGGLTESIWCCRGGCSNACLCTEW